MKVGIITFHASHNYGSMLQAYALQKVVESLGHECEIINFRTERQREFYKPYWSIYSPVKRLKNFIRFPKHSINNYKKFCLFENFLEKTLKLSSKEFQTGEELESQCNQYEAYISGSDQIWNVSCLDWDMAYGLGFVKKGKRIAYAPSMGPNPENVSHSNRDRMNIFAESLKFYDSISVRESATAKTVGEFIGYEPDVTLDPTLLLSPYEWKQLADVDAMVKGDYILLYTPWENKDIYEEAVEIGKRFQMQVVVTMHYYYNIYRLNPNVKFVEASGPKEFLNLISNARIVMGASFHAVAFAIIFGRQLYAYEGDKDSRVAQLLQLVKLTEFIKRPENVLTSKELDILYMDAHSKLQTAIKYSLDFIKTALK